MNLKTSTYNADTHVLVPKEPTRKMLERMSVRYWRTDQQQDPLVSPMNDEHMRLWGITYAAALSTAPGAPEPAHPLGLPSCGKPLCTEADHHPLCTIGAQPVQEGLTDEQMMLEEALFELWLQQGNANGANPSMWKAWLARALLASQPADKNAIMQELSDQAQALDLGYGPKACPTCGKSRQQAAQGQDGEAVYQIKSLLHPNGWHDVTKQEFDSLEHVGSEVRIVYTRPQAAQPVGLTEAQRKNGEMVLSRLEAITTSNATYHCKQMAQEALPCMQAILATKGADK